MKNLYIDWLSTAWDNPGKALGKYPERGLTTPHKRLIKALADNNASPLDLASIIRSVVRFEEVNNGRKFITLPNQVADKIHNTMWSKVSVETIKKSSKTTLKAALWEPKWLPGSDVERPDKAALKSIPRRNDADAEGDPFLQHMGFANYCSRAQREALRSVFCAPPSYTLAINLPTGSGKSLCAFLPAILHQSAHNDQLGVTLIIVPTVSLALDMASKIEPIIGHRVAYRGDEEDAEAIRIRCIRGVQGPVIASPEAISKSLGGSILEASKKGFFRYLVIDEAHMVLSWGDEFRPAFQQVAAFRRELIKRSKGKPFLTILMSATFTQYHLSWLKKMFSEEERFKIVHAVRLRPEPCFWQKKAPSQDKRIAWVIEAIRHIPKPVIVYTVRRESTTEWYNIIRDEGFSRVGKIHGNMGTADRRSQIDQWNNDKIDIMVATSAFGLGVDKPDIRAVIHAELPETVDRFYQDVGRGGRDGFGSISLMCWAEGDRKIVENIQNPSFIGEEKGSNRWRKMFNKKEVVDATQGVYKIFLDTPAEIDMQNEANELWNLRTLLLLDRAGVIKLEISDDNNSRRCMNIRILYEGHSKKGMWGEKVEPLRNELKKEYAKSSKLLEQLIKIDRCYSHLFSECYTVSKFNIGVVRACGGCPKCRGTKTFLPPGKIIARLYPQGSFTHEISSAKVRSLLNNKDLLSVFYPDKLQGQNNLIKHLGAFIDWLLDNETINIVSFPTFRNYIVSHTKNNQHWKFFFHNTVPNDVTKHHLTVMLISSPLPEWWAKVWERLGQLPSKTILVLPKNISAPDHPGRFVRDVVIGKTIDLNVWEDEYLE